MSTVKVDTIKTTGNVEVYTCKAWVNFDGTQTAGNMIRESGNVTSITDHGTGSYSVNFTNSMPDTNYAAVANASKNFTGSFNRIATTGDSAAPSTSSIRLKTNRADTTTLEDCEYIAVAVFR
jgi:hypothetical protein